MDYLFFICPLPPPPQKKKKKIGEKKEKSKLKLIFSKHCFTIVSCSDIHSVSNVLTSEFQAAILLRCQDENEQSLVDYLCHGQGLLLLQMLCILASKV